MKTSHICPKCNSTAIVKFEGTPYSQSSIGAINKWGMASAVIDRYFCTDCGYTEEYAKLNKKFQKWAKQMLDKQGGMGDGFV